LGVDILATLAYSSIVGHKQRAMKRAFIIRFSLTALFISIGCLLLMAGFSGVGMCFGLATIFFMPRSELYGPIPRRELWTFLGFVVLFVAVIVVCKILVPSTAAISVERVFRHPAIVFPMWLLMLWGLHRHWQKQKLESESPGR
jgi:hypothetical protein